ncbi:SDR family oxidoreductase [Pseudoduganella namucuonensis]|uniref:3-oxoacyl-[acyl-carrier protein] reductase n=1 Tax=Pseudoduganella namucuonensis TaxID=1035707 RepID=A0A1I7LV10_9BURK|nr:SDR family oxidoreductase [Pseudoduganella namucuonensis]SFV13518.1 3-oxoacyl-[acyl-carrier protein] reductase [Pseudoduganella namucuonensis]
MFKDYDAIQVGETHSLEKTITEADVRKFVEMTGDDNPLHVDRAYAETTAFKDIVVHGMLGASFISTVIGTKLPGTGALWVSQNIEFLLPVRLGDVLTVSCTVLKKHDRERLLELDTRIVNQHKQLILTGTGKVKVLTTAAPEAPAAQEARPRAAIVTGGAGGIGKAICLRLARDGYNVVVNYRGQADRAKRIVEEINAGEGGRAVAVQADIATEAGAQALYQAAVRAFGEVSVLVNNASPHINPKPFGATEWSDVQQQIDVQVKGAFLMTGAVVPEMSARKFGRIVNITSQVLDGQPSVSWTGYAMAKGALAVFSNYMAAELGPQGITVNCVSPGMCETTLIGDISEKAQLMIARQTPLRRLAKPADVAAAVAYLVSDDAGFVTGDTVAVNGGMAIR